MYTLSKIQPTQSALGGILIALSLTAAPLANAQSNARPQTGGFEVGVSTLGVYIAPKYSITNKIVARLPIYVGNATDSFNYDGNTINATLDTKSFALMADYHPWENGVRISAGAGLGGYVATGNITNPTLGGVAFAGTFDFTIEQKNKVVPILSVGYALPLGKNVSILAEIGAKIGTYGVTTTGSTVDPLLQAQFDAEIVSANSELAKVKALPFATLGIQINF